MDSNRGGDFEDDLRVSQGLRGLGCFA
jgi:hypothetical protein